MQSLVQITSFSTTMVLLMQIELSLLWVLSTTLQKRLLITSTHTARRLVYLRFVFTDHGLQRHSLRHFLRQLRRLLSSIEQRSQVLLQIHFTLMLLQHFVKQVFMTSLSAVVDMVLVLRILLLHQYSLYTRNLRRTLQRLDSQSVSLMMLLTFHFQRLSQLLSHQLLVQRSASSGVSAVMVL